MEDASALKNNLNSF